MLQDWFWSIFYSFLLDFKKTDWILINFYKKLYNSVILGFNFHWVSLKKYFYKIFNFTQICIFGLEQTYDDEKYCKIPAHNHDVFNVLLLGSLVWPNE